MRLIKTAALCAAITPALAATPALACASCGCTFTSDWLAQGLVTQPGQALTIRYDYVPQAVLQTDTHRVDTAAIELPPEREIERRTDNHYLTVSYDRQFANDWGISVAVPVLWRPHRTIGEDTTEETRSNTHGIGDIRLSARWQGLSTPKGVTGLQFGLILPTGGFHQTFTSGPGAGEVVDRGLQPGSGTTQAVLGAYHYRRVGSEVALVAQAQVQFALNSREDFRPGTVIEGSTAVQWLGLGKGTIVPQIQINGRVSVRDRGDNSDRENSGGEQIYVAPGFTAKLNSALSAFANVQVPLYMRVNGYQLTPRVVLSTGLHARF
ncbi:hypothetical protein [Novosphingobium sp.]|uniref:hypothetical protein n=1 Tax=Novosphingobium sp. TaxID=1874826 RepID=UPI0038BD1215